MLSPPTFALKYTAYIHHELHQLYYLPINCFERFFLPPTMPIIRNPFRKDHHADENTRPSSNGGATSDEGFGKTDIVGTKPLSIKPTGDNAPVEYKLSGVLTSWYGPNTSADARHRDQ